MIPLQVNYKGPDVDKGALHLSVIKGKHQILKLLLEYNPDVNIKVFFSLVCMCVCVWCGGGWKSGECCLTFCSQDETGESPLHTAARTYVYLITCFTHVSHMFHTCFTHV